MWMKWLNGCLHCGKHFTDNLVISSCVSRNYQFTNDSGRKLFHPGKCYVEHINSEKHEKGCH